MGKVILFLRVSSEKQQLQSQELAARRLAYKDNYTDADILPPIQYKESGSKLEAKDRVGLQELYKLLESRDDIDAIYVTELSRLSRKSTVLETIKEFLVERKIQLVCENPSFKLLNKEKKIDKYASIVFALFGAFAEQEIIEKRERFARGKEQMALDGRFNGGKLPFGYKKGENKKIIVDYIDNEGTICGKAKIVQQIFNLYEEGYSQPKLAKELIRRGYEFVPTNLINRILSNVSYTGELREEKVIKVKDRINGEIKDSKRYARRYPQLISREQFERCRKIADANNENLSKSRNIYYAEHLVRCVTCGSYLSASGCKDSYHCYSAYKPEGVWRMDYYQRKKCDNKMSISINVLDSLLWYVAADLEAAFMMEASEKKVIELKEKIELLNQRIESVDRLIQKVDERRKRAAKLYERGDYNDEDYEQARSDIAKERFEYLNEKTTYQEDIVHYEDAISLIEEQDSGLKMRIEEAKQRNDKDLVRNLIGEYYMKKILQRNDYLNRTMELEDDLIRYNIIHRQIESVSIERVVIYQRIKNTWKETKANRVSIHPSKICDSDSHSKTLNYLLINSVGKRTTYLNENRNHSILPYGCEDLLRYIKYEKNGATFLYEIVPIDYLDRYSDTHKRKLRKMAKDGVEGFIRIEDAMAMSGLKYHQVYSSLQNGELKAKLIRHKYYIDPQDAEDYVQKMSTRHSNTDGKIAAFEIAKRYNLGYTLVLRRIYKGVVPFEHIDGHYYVQVEDAEAYFGNIKKKGDK